MIISVTKILIFAMITKTVKSYHGYRSTFEILVLLGFYAVLSGSYKPFGTNYRFRPQGLKGPRTVCTAWPLQMGPMGCPETSETTNPNCVTSQKS